MNGTVANRKSLTNVELNLNTSLNELLNIEGYKNEISRLPMCFSFTNVLVVPITQRGCTEISVIRLKMNETSKKI